MKRTALPLLILLTTFCAGGRGGDTVTARPGHGAISVRIEPNPIVATRVSGDTYDFPFEVIVRETGGRPVDISRVSAQVFALGGIPIGSESYDAARINSLGYGTRVPPNGEIRYKFAPRKSVPDQRLFGSVSAQLRVEGTDDTGTAAIATTTVTVTR